MENRNNMPNACYRGWSAGVCGDATAACMLVCLSVCLATVIYVRCIVCDCAEAQLYKRKMAEMQRCCCGGAASVIVRTLMRRRGEGRGHGGQLSIIKVSC